MSEFIHQKLILDKSDTKWHEYFLDKEYLYLKHVLNGILNNNGGFDSIGMDSSRLSLSRLFDFPNNLTSNICFWNFIDAIGQASAHVD